MNSTDLIIMLGNFSESLLPVQRLITGGAYLIGILFFYVALHKLRVIGNARARSSSQEKMFVPISYILAGSALIFLPSAISVMSNTAFGAGNILRYSNFNQLNTYNSMIILIRTAGLLWFVRGSVLLAHASHPGVQEGPKGLTFLIAGVLAINIENTMSMIDTMLSHLMKFL